MSDSISSNMKRSQSSIASSILRHENDKQENLNQNVDGHKMQCEKFDQTQMPPFTISQVRAAIPKHCFQKDIMRSMYYFAKDVACIVILGVLAHFLCKTWWVWPFYWLAQGIMFSALFVVGHECGHGSFSNNKTLNSIMGHIAHSFLLVPYNGWRLSHKKHHQNHGHAERDESWTPIHETIYKRLSPIAKFFRLMFPGPLMALPGYLLFGSPGKKASHFNPKSKLFQPSDRMHVLFSNVCWSAMAALLLGAAIIFGPSLIIKIYVVPYWVFVAFFGLITYLHHQGYKEKIPWYRGKEWNYVRGALSTIDRDYGILNEPSHNIGTHVVHHFFPQIPHYHLVEATKAIKPVLGKYHKVAEKNSKIPFELLGIMCKSLSEDHFVKNGGDIVFQETDPSFKSPAMFIRSYFGF